ncbi:MAG: hypothetical protein IKR17_01060 [Bacteroidales bacterium]|nr:hypothetical protein [Bacteroidales bacterium]
MKQLTLFDDCQPSLFGTDDLESIDGLSGIDREKFKKNIVDLVTNSLLNWKKPWQPFSDSIFTSVNGRVVLSPCNAYSRKPYGANAASLNSYTLGFNEMYGTNFAPIFITYSMLKKNDWHLIHNNLGSLSDDSLSTGVHRIYEVFWAKVTDEPTIERLNQLLEVGESLPFGFILANDGKTFLQRAMKGQDVVLVQNIQEQPFEVKSISAPEAQKIEYIDSIIEAFSSRVANVYHDQSDRCYYMPATDSIHLVPAKAFSIINEYYSTRFHETIHSTHGGKPIRINRSFPHQTGFGSIGYAMEELVAEIGAMLLCAELGVKYNRKDKVKALCDEEGNSIAYLGSWLEEAKKLYKDDKETTLLAAYGHAERAVNYILKDIDFESYIPQSIKDQADAAADILLCNNDELRAVNVVSDGYIRLTFAKFVSAEKRQELEDLGFHFSKAFKAFQIKNDEKGMQAWETWRKKHKQDTTITQTDNSDRERRLRLARARAAAAMAILALMKLK